MVCPGSLDALVQLNYSNPHPHGPFAVLVGLTLPDAALVLDEWRSLDPEHIRWLGHRAYSHCNATAPGTRSARVRLRGRTERELRIDLELRALGGGSCLTDGVEVDQTLTLELQRPELERTSSADQCDLRSIVHRLAGSDPTACGTRVFEADLTLLDRLHLDRPLGTQGTEPRRCWAETARAGQSAWKVDLKRSDLDLKPFVAIEVLTTTDLFVLTAGEAILRCDRGAPSGIEVWRTRCIRRAKDFAAVCLEWEERGDFECRIEGHPQPR